MEAFGNHLRAQENIDLTDAEIAQDPAEIVLSLHGIGIHADGAGVRKELEQGVFDFLGAETGVADFRVTALRVWAECGHPFGVAANMAANLLFLPMVSEGNAAVRAPGNIPAQGTLQG